jgi:hypothetical protein
LPREHVKIKTWVRRFYMLPVKFSRRILSADFILREESIFLNYKNLTLFPYPCYGELGETKERESG